MDTNDVLLESRDCLLLMVDIQQSMLNPCMEAEQVQQRAAILIDMAQILEIPIVFTEQNPVKLGKFLPELTGKVSVPTVLSKIEFGCFENQAISETIEKSGRKTIILCGIETHICIFQSGLQAIQRGYRIHVPMDATSSPTVLNRDIGLRRLEKSGAVISSSEMIIFELLKRAGTSQFRRALPVIKNR